MRNGELQENSVVKESLTTAEGDYADRREGVMMNTPKLRFPEFKDSGAWEEKKLGEVCNFVNEKISLDKITISNYISTENLLSDFKGVTISSKLPNVNSVTAFKKNDILISNIRPYLRKVWFSNKNGGASNDVIVVRAKSIITPQYLSFLLINDVFIDYVMIGAKGVKMPRGDIGIIKNFPIFLPTPAEQQRIADCLSSLDELITAEGEKLEALKQHKKGLMQGLFV